MSDQLLITRGREHGGVPLVAVVGLLTGSEVAAFEAEFNRWTCSLTRLPTPTQKLYKVNNSETTPETEAERIPILQRRN